MATVSHCKLLGKGKQVTMQVTMDSEAWGRNTLHD